MLSKVEIHCPVPKGHIILLSPVYEGVAHLTSPQPNAYFIVFMLTGHYFLFRNLFHYVFKSLFTASYEFHDFKYCFHFRYVFKVSKTKLQYQPKVFSIYNKR